MKHTKVDCTVQKNNHFFEVKTDPNCNVRVMVSVFLHEGDDRIKDISLSNENKANAELISEAFNVANECGFTPRELLDQRNDLLENLIRIVDRVEEQKLQENFPSAYKRAKEAKEKATS